MCANQYVVYNDGTAVSHALQMTYTTKFTITRIALSGLLLFPTTLCACAVTMYMYNNNNNNKMSNAKRAYLPTRIILCALNFSHFFFSRNDRLCNITAAAV